MKQVNRHCLVVISLPNRILKESICTSENIDNLTIEEENFFYRLLVNCDDFGRADARVPILRAKCYPLRLDKVKEKDIDKWLMTLVKENLITLYMVGDRRYLQMVTWDKHQQIRAKRSKFPSPDSDGAYLISDDINCNQINSNDGICHRNPIQSNPIQSESNPNPIAKIKFAEFVSMTEEEHQKLVLEHGEVKVKRMIEVLDNYKGSKGKKYKSDYRAILNWVVGRVEEEMKKGNTNGAFVEPTAEKDYSSWDRIYYDDGPDPKPT